MPWRPDYITVDELKHFLRIYDTDDDIELAAVVGAASRAIDKHTNRQFGKVDSPVSRRYRAWFDYGRGLWCFDIDDLMDVAGLMITVGGTVLTAADYELEPVNAAADDKPWTLLTVQSASATQPTGVGYELDAWASWGWLAYPVPVVEAAYLQSSRFNSRRDSPYGVAGSPDQGTPVRLLSRVDPDVGVSLTDYIRPRRTG
jgi:hypothetical protein